MQKRSTCGLILIEFLKCLYIVLVFLVQVQIRLLFFVLEVYLIIV